jgi:hypothetical protein
MLGSVLGFRTGLRVLRGLRWYSGSAYSFLPAYFRIKGTRTLQSRYRYR